MKKEILDKPEELVEDQISNIVRSISKATTPITDQIINELSQKYAEEKGKRERQKKLKEKLKELEEKAISISNIKSEILDREKKLDDLYLSKAPEYEYKVIRIHDTTSGRTDIKTIEDTLYYYSVRGWRVKFIFTNELGINQSSVGVGAVSFGTNATMDEVIVLLERKIIEF